MAGIIKNQILKHLSRYVKNLSSDKINLSTFKGEGELRNLELDEEVMTELLALPTWMKLTHATCNHVLIRIPWTKLKSVPIHLSLDEVNIRVEACEQLREGSGATLPAPSFGKYGFVNKVIDGITATVNSVEITFNSPEFESKVQIARIRVESRAPDWNRVDLSGTRLKDMQRGETLIFKEMEWQTLRLEARSTLDRHLAPLRLLANQAKARIVIKKKLSDSQVVGCRLSLILDDLLWVLTDSQILAALHFMGSLSGLVKQATETTQRIKAARKLETLPEYQAQQSQATAAGDVIKNLTKFDTYDVKETSYHFVCEKIDLHFCDDPGAGRSHHPDLKEGGALQLSLNQVMIDFYPYHLAKGTRKFWLKYSSNNTLAQWLQQALQGFKISLIDALSTGSLHTPLTRTNLYHAPSFTSGAETNPVKDEVTKQLAKLMSTCLIIKVQDMSLYRVTTASKRTSPLPFISTFIDRPKDLPVVHTEFAWFYYPGEICFPLPSPKVYAYLHPIQIHLDICTILWLNAFVTNLQSSMAGVNSTDDPGYVDVRVEALMPKVIFENTMEYPGQKERPKSLHLQVSRLSLSNYRSSETGTLHQLTQSIELLQRGDLIYGSEFPSKDTDVPLLQEKFVKHAEGQDKLRLSKKLNCSSFTDVASDLTQELLWTDPRDVWYIILDPFWADFHVEEKRKQVLLDSDPGFAKKKGKPGAHDGKNVSTLIYPFVDAVPISAWIYVDETNKVDGTPNPKNIHAIFGAGGAAKVQLTHYQFLFVMRMVEAFGEMSLYLTLDTKAIVGDSNSLVTFVGYINSLDLSLLFPPPAEGKRGESPSLADSANPESCSVQCDNQEDSVEKPLEVEFRKCSVFNRPFPSASGSTSPMARSVHGGSNPNIGINSGNGLHEMNHNAKHSLTNLSVSFNKGGGTPDSEIVSNWSNISSDSSDNFVQLDVADNGVTAVVIPNQEEDVEDLDSEIEVAVEAEDNSFVEERATPSPVAMSQEISITRMTQDNSTTSVLTLKLQGIELGQEGRELSSLIKLQCKTVGLKESAEMSWKDFQEAFSGRKKSAEEINEVLHGSPTQRRAVKLRLAQSIDGDSVLRKMSSEEVLSVIKEARTSATPRINLMDRPGTTSPIRDAIFQATNPNLEIKADFTNAAQFKLLASTMTGLADLLEDEILPNPIPMKMDLVGIHLELVEDKPPANITSPGSVPIKIRIPSSLHISRDESGVFQIGLPQSHAVRINETAPASTPASVNHDEDQEKEYLRKELERTYAQLQLSQQRNAALENEHAENEYLKGLVVSLQDEVCKLQEEAMELLRKLKQSNHSH